MNWTTRKDLQAQLSRRWAQGDLLRPIIKSEAVHDEALPDEAVPSVADFPYRLALKGPSATELAERFGAVQVWLADLSAIPHIRIDWREVNHRVHGTQRLPQSLWVDRLDDALALIGKRAEAARFAMLVSLTRQANSALLPWLAKCPVSALDLADSWPRLLDVVAWLQYHPRPGIYLRQVDIAGVHSKFIEAQRGVLTELLDLALPAAAITAEHTGSRRGSRSRPFAARYGFRDKPTRIRFRLLDARIGLIAGAVCPDITLDADSFACLDMPLQRVFITENEINFLAFPPVAAAMVIFGAGYGWEALARAQWLRQCVIDYWGDIDTHGFAILHQLRCHFPHVASFLMDRPTLLAHQTLWGTEPDPVRHDLPSLTAAEGALYDELRDNRIRPHLRLEQEMIGFGCVEAALAGVANPCG